MHFCDQIAASSAGKNSSASGVSEQSFAGDLWQDTKFNVELKRDHIENNLLKSHDLSNRVTADVLHQYRYFLGRVGKQRLREAKMQAADYLILLLAGAALGTLAKVSDETFGALGYTYTVIAICNSHEDAINFSILFIYLLFCSDPTTVCPLLITLICYRVAALLCKIAALRSFSLDKYITGEGDTIDNFDTVIKPLVYLSMFYFFNNPRSSFRDNYVVLLCLVYYVTGMAYVFAILLEPSLAQLWCVLLPVVLTLIANQDKHSQTAKLVGNYCYPKWALEAFVIANAERYSGVWLITRCGSLMQSGYDLNNWTRCLIYLCSNAEKCSFDVLVS
ncbi:hypothetical protein ACSBR2_035110 [Camellia fascicularis]